MKYLLDVTETYRVDTEKEATALIEEAKRNQRQYSLAKYTSTQKSRKEKGEVVETWYKVTLSKKFTEEKEPYSNYEVQYVEVGSFPTVEEDTEDED